jgi:hypothetical protein
MSWKCRVSLSGKSKFARVAFSAILIPGMAVYISMQFVPNAFADFHNELEEWGMGIGDASKYGNCEDPEDPEDSSHCPPREDNCIGDQIVGECLDQGGAAIEIPGTDPKKYAASGKLTDVKAWGTCESGEESQKCTKCGKFYCAKAKVWDVAGCPTGTPPVGTYAISIGTLCQPE